MKKMSYKEIKKIEKIEFKKKKLKS